MNKKIDIMQVKCIYAYAVNSMRRLSYGNLTFQLKILSFKFNAIGHYLPQSAVQIWFFSLLIKLNKLTKRT